MTKLMLALALAATVAMPAMAGEGHAMKAEETVKGYEATTKAVVADAAEGAEAMAVAADASATEAVEAVEGAAEAAHDDMEAGHAAH